jgi:Cas6b C-terminal domain/Cas6b N-terminal domain
MQTTLSTLTLEFDIPCSSLELPKFRGVMAELGGFNNNLFHQHDNAGEQHKLLHRYPLIQYRSYNNKPYIYSINEGREALTALWKSGAIEHYYKKAKGINLHIDAYDKPVQYLRLLPVQDMNLYRYRIVEYVPFNNANYSIYKSLPSFLNKVAFLEKLLAQHLQGMAHSLGWQWNKNEHQLLVTIDDIDRFEKIHLHQNDFIAIDLVFYTNALLPDRIAIGNDMAFGKGWLFKKRKQILN